LECRLGLCVASKRAATHLMESATSQPAAKLLPSRPASAPGGRCQIPGARFTSVPARCEAEIRLPPMRRRRSRFADKQQQPEKVHRGPAGSTPWAARRSNSQSASSPALATVVGSRAGHAQECQGDFCNAEIRYPPSLQDLESSQHPWMKQARELCNRTLGDKHGPKLMNPVEMVGCLQLDEEEKESEDSKCFTSDKAVRIPDEQQRPAARFGAPGFVSAAWICEARAYPCLCRWLQDEAGWLLNPQDPDQVAEAAAKMLEDEAAEGHEQKKSRGGRAPAFELDGCTPAVHYRTRVVPVCGPCFCVHAAIHSVLVMLRVHKRGIWARREKKRRAELEERKRREQLESFLQRERPPQPRRAGSEAVLPSWKMSNGSEAEAVCTLTAGSGS